MTDHHPDCTADHRAAVGNPVFTDSRDGMEKCVMCIVATKAERRGVKAARESVTLTADSPQPALWSVILVNGLAYQRMSGTSWQSVNGAPWAWLELLEVAGKRGIRLLIEGGSR